MDKKAMLKKYAPEKTYENNGKIKTAKVRCAGCNKWISLEDKLDDVQISVTKRGTGIFFHTDCMNKVWKSKIATA